MKKTLSACIASALAIIMVVSATFAWFTAKDSVTNHLETAQITDGSTQIVEVFTPPAEWVPGQKVTKEISVANNGSGDVLARVSFEEALKLVNGPAKENGKSIDDPENKDKIPQLFNAGDFMKAPWAEAKDVFDRVEEISGLTLWVREVTNGTQSSYAYAAFYEIKDGPHKGQYQKATADFETSTTDDGKKIVKVSNIKYWAFDGMTDEKAAWANFADPKTGGTVSIPETSKIANPITDLKKWIIMEYNDLQSITDSTPKAGSWWYNAKDGFFYYIGKLSPGSISPNLLTGLSLSPEADSTYAGMKFDLIANLESIQNTVDAIKATDGWGLDGQTELISALTPFCS
jgi:predicted ribosomally synthesized peptide with SipW-like signal peptide